MLTFANYRLPTSALALLRIWFAMGALLLGVAPDPSWMTNYPASFWRPAPGIGQLWGGVPPLSVIVGLRVVLLLALVALLVGWRTRFTSILVGVAGMTLSSIAYGFGKIDHLTLVLWAMAIFMSWSGWGNRWSLDERASREVPVAAWPIALAAAWYATGLATAGIVKYWGGWLGFDDQATYAYVVEYTYLHKSYGPLAPMLVGIEVPWAWEILDWATVTLELSPIFLLLRPTLLARAIALLMLFHISNALVLDINFAIFTLAYLPVLLLLFDDAVLDRACTYGENLVKKVVHLRRVALSAGLILAFVSWRGGLHLGIGDFLIPISLPVFVWLVKRDRLRVDGVPVGSVRAADGSGTGVVEEARQLPEGVPLPAAQLQMRLATHSFWLRLR